jgi:NIMA (never in mitosis gene a)-related kinase
VYQVKRHADKQIYALKKVRLNNMPQKERMNALNEIRLLASIESPFIIGYK